MRPPQGNAIVEQVNELHLHNNRIETLVDQLYGINRRLMVLEGQLVKLADRHKVDRRSFIKEYRGSELDPNWIFKAAKIEHFNAKDEGFQKYS